MRPRKRDKDNDIKKQDHKPDHELFIQAYESKILFCINILYLCTVLEEVATELYISSVI